MLDLEAIKERSKLVRAASWWTGDDVELILPDNEALIAEVERLGKLVKGHRCYTMREKSWLFRYWKEANDELD